MGPLSQSLGMGVEVALAVLQRQGQWLLQLRDDIPGIIAPGCWGLFGGHLDPGETPVQALRRELWEEIRLRVDTVEPWYRSEGQERIRHVFRADLQVPLEQLQLLEGQDFCLAWPQQLTSGRCTSQRLGESRGLAPSLEEALLHYRSELKATTR